MWHGFNLIETLPKPIMFCKLRSLGRVDSHSELAPNMAKKRLYIFLICTYVLQIKKEEAQENVCATVYEEESIGQGSEKCLHEFRRVQKALGSAKIC